MKPRHFILSAAMLVALASPGFAANSVAESQDQEYRDSLELYRQSEKDAQIRLFGYSVFVAGFLFVLMIPYRRSLRRSLELSERHQKTLEEIRDLLKKP
jgi:hypothetical protein